MNDLKSFLFASAILCFASICCGSEQYRPSKESRDVGSLSNDKQNRHGLAGLLAPHLRQPSANKKKKSQDQDMAKRMNETKPNVKMVPHSRSKRDEWNSARERIPGDEEILVGGPVQTVGNFQYDGIRVAGRTKRAPGRGKNSRGDSDEMSQDMNMEDMDPSGEMRRGGKRKNKAKKGSPGEDMGVGENGMEGSPGGTRGRGNRGRGKDRDGTDESRAGRKGQKNRKEGGPPGGGGQAEIGGDGGKMSANGDAGGKRMGAGAEMSRTDSGDMNPADSTRSG